MTWNNSNTEPIDIVMAQHQLQVLLGQIEMFYVLQFMGGQGRVCQHKGYVTIMSFMGSNLTLALGREEEGRDSLTDVVEFVGARPLEQRPFPVPVFKLSRTAGAFVVCQQIRGKLQPVFAA